MPAIRTYGLTKYYGRVRGIEDLDLEIEQGEIFALLGPNGAGKTTTIRLLLDLLRPTRGRAEIFGLDIRRYSREIRQRLGFIPGDVYLYDGMSGKEFLELMASFHRRHNGQRRQELVERLGLDSDLNRSIRSYSKGMKQKLAIVQAFMNDAELLVLDEPTLGLDPLMQREFYQLLQEEREGGKTVFLSSHLLPEVERLCDRVGMVRDGLLVAVERVSELKRKKVRRMELVLARELSAEELHLEGVEVLHQEGRRVELAVHGQVKELLERLAQLPVEDIIFPEATLEDIFFKFYGLEPSSSLSPSPLPGERGSDEKLDNRI